MLFDLNKFRIQEHFNNLYLDFFFSLKNNIYKYNV